VHQPGWLFAVFEQSKAPGFCLLASPAVYRLNDNVEGAGSVAKVSKLRRKIAWFIQA
jgi:hypothetical protein